MQKTRRDKGEKKIQRNTILRTKNINIENRDLKKNKVSNISERREPSVNNINVSADISYRNTYG